MVVEFERRGRVGLITLNRPEARNAVNGDVARGMEEALDTLENDPELWVGVVTATGSVFCAGADLKEIAAGNGASLSTKRGGFAGIVRREREKPLIAAIPGTAVAGGCEIALACDLIVAAHETVFGLPEVKRSLVAAAGGLFRLPRAMGRAMALEMIMTGDPVPAARALELGMINGVVAADEVVAEAMKLADRICANAPVAVRESRKVALGAFEQDDESLWRESGRAFGVVAKTEDFSEGPRAFVEKRAPEWKGR